MNAAGSFEQVLAALQAHGCRVAPRGDSATAQCPAHDDQNPSLSVKAVTGRTLLFCHAGCRREDVVAALGLTMADLFDDATGVTYRYDNGRVVHRSPDKRFHQQNTDRPPELYRSSNVRAGVAAGDTIFIVEGEGDVHALETLGAVATTSPMGAGKWSQVDATVLHAAKRVVIVADDDEPGRRHAAEIYESLTGTGPDLTIVKAAAGKDAADHVTAGLGLDDFVAVPFAAAARFRGEPPVRLTATPDAPPFPLDALPGPVRDMVEALAEFTQTDPGMAATAALAVLATSVGAALIAPRDGWVEGLNLYAMTVAAPGERKSAVLSAMTAPLRTAEQDLVAQLRPVIVEAAELRRVADGRADNARRAASQDPVGSDSLTAEAVAARMAAEAIPIPAEPRLLADDTTPEALISLLAAQRGTLGVISEEAGIFEIIAGRYSSQTPNLDVFLKGHSGDPIRVDRKGRPTEYIERPALTMALMAQPQVLQRIGGNAEFAGRGLLARFLYCVPPSRVGDRRIGAPSPAPEIVAAYAALIDCLVRGRGDGDIVLRLTSDAAGELRQLEYETEAMLAAGGEMEYHRDWGAKFVGAVCRIAGLLHLAEEPTTGPTSPVSAATFGAARLIGDYYRAHALRAFGDMALDPRVRDAHHVLATLLRSGCSNFSRRDLFDKVRRGPFKKVTDLDPVLQLLAEHNIVEPVEPATREGPGRPSSPRYRLHPDAQSAISAQ